MTKEMTVHVPVKMIIFTFSLVLLVLLFCSVRFKHQNFSVRLNFRQ